MYVDDTTISETIAKDKHSQIHSSLTSEQSKTLEAVQRKACQIIIGGGTHSSNCSSHKLDSLHTRRQQQTKQEAQLSPRDRAMRRVN